ncbi:hypothetical protein AOLI_G00322330 [Acnodon oligacanthus]
MSSSGSSVMSAFLLSWMSLMCFSAAAETEEVHRAELTVRSSLAISLYSEAWPSGGVRTETVINTSAGTASHNTTAVRVTQTTGFIQHTAFTPDSELRVAGQDEQWSPNEG